MSNTRTNTLERNGHSNKGINKLGSPWSRAVASNSEWNDKDEFLDVVYWSRQVLGIIIGVIWGIIPLQGFTAITLFTAINCGIVYLYCMNFQKIDEDEYGGIWELLKEGLMTSFACFCVTWIVFYTGLHFDEVNTPKSNF